jgi:hypothetical protein
MDASCFHLGRCNDRGACAKGWNRCLFIFRAHASTVIGLCSINKYLPVNTSSSSGPNSTHFVSSSSSIPKLQKLPPQEPTKRGVSYSMLMLGTPTSTSALAKTTSSLLIPCIGISSLGLHAIFSRISPSRYGQPKDQGSKHHHLAIMASKVAKTLLTPFDDIVSLCRS